MSWVSKSENQYQITTGDGKVYTPKWRNLSRVRDYNLAEFDFPGVSGTLVSRGLPRGHKYALEIYFDTEDHIDVSKAFGKSADDPRPWTVQHPMYGIIRVQPGSLTFDNTVLSFTKVTGTLLETISGQYPITTISPVEQINTSTAATTVALGDAFGNTTTPTPSLINQMQQDTARSYNKGRLSVPADFAEPYTNAFNTALGKINTATADPLAAIRAVQRVIQAPALFKNSVQSRISLLQSELEDLGANLIGATFGRKQLFQAQGGSIVAAMALATANPISGDYASKTEVFNIIGQLTNAYNNYIASLGTLQSTNGGSPMAYIPSAAAITALQQLVGYTLANLFAIASNAKQERSFVLEQDSNWVVLTHRLYGLDADGNNIQTLIAQNNAGLSEMLLVRKNRPIVYYV